MDVRMKWGLNLLEKALKTGEAIGAEMKLTQLTGALAKHPRAVGEEIGLLLGGKGQKAVNTFTDAGGMEALTKKLNELAQQYPEAAIKLGIKESKRGYAVAKATVRNGDDVLYNSAISVTKTDKGLVTKTRQRFLDTQSRSAADSSGNVVSGAKDSITSFSLRGNVRTGEVTAKLGENGEAAIMQTSRNAAEGTKINIEKIDGVVDANIEAPAAKISVIADKEKTAAIVKQELEKDKKVIKGLVSRIQAAVTGKTGAKESEKVSEIMKEAENAFKKATSEKMAAVKGAGLFGDADSLIKKVDFEKTAQKMEKLVKDAKKFAPEADKQAEKAKAVANYYESLKDLLLKNKNMDDSQIKRIKTEMDELEKLAKQNGINLNKIPDYLKDFIDKFY